MTEIESLVILLAELEQIPRSHRSLLKWERGNGSSVRTLSKLNIFTKPEAFQLLE